MIIDLINIFKDNIEILMINNMISNYIDNFLIYNNKDNTLKKYDCNISKITNDKYKIDFFKTELECILNKITYLKRNNKNIVFTKDNDEINFVDFT